MLHKAVKEFKNIKVIHHNYPFDKECNPYISINMHPHACFMTRGAIAARNQGNYWEMASLLYENQPKKMEDLIKLVETLNFDKEKFMYDFNSKAVTDEIETELRLANSKDIDATPTMFIDQEEVVGVKPYNELRDILIKHGAKRK
jgi:protein-disulfide isomerase